MTTVEADDIAFAQPPLPAAPLPAAVVPLPPRERRATGQSGMAASAFEQLRLRESATRSLGC